MQLLKMPERTLVLAPHTDDGEFGCGGTIARLAEAGAEVFYLAFSAAEKSVPEGFPSDVLRREVIEATQILGLMPDHLIVLDYPVRELPLHRQRILDDMIRIGREVDPDMVLLPSSLDTHQDHQTIASEGFRAFKSTTMLGYELPWNNLTFPTQAFVFLAEEHVDMKVKALASYRSQEGRPYASELFVTSLARTRGTQIGCEFAEAFEVVRWVVR